MPRGDKTHMEKRRYPVGVDPRKDARIAVAKLAQEIREDRTPEQQLDLLLRRPGRSVRERAKLHKQIVESEKEAA